MNIDVDKDWFLAVTVSRKKLEQHKQATCVRKKMDLHMVTHVVMFAVIAALFKKYVQVLFQLDDLKEKCINHDLKHSDELDLGTTYQQESHKEKQQFSSFGRCQTVHYQRQVCRFRNICYKPNENMFIFFQKHGDSELHFFHKNNLPLLSTPIGFYGNDFTLTFLKENISTDLGIKWINGTSYIFSRFKSDNLMHVMHDDIIPLFFTLQYFESFKSNVSSYSERFDVQLMFMDDWPSGEYREIYHLFTKSEPLYKEKLQTEEELLCFPEAVVGLLSDTLWYNYGFHEHQGPVTDLAVLDNHIKSTRQYILQNLNIDASNSVSDYIIIISRKENRKILNEGDLVEKLSNELGMKIISLSSETHTFTEMISLVTSCKGLIGMHGSLLILSMFLKPGCFLIEIFPYAVPAAHYTPYKTLAEIPGMNIVYYVWENKDVKSSVGHVDYPRELGGLSHLTHYEQEKILNQEIVPKHLCCNDPSWLYHIYQDTVVDVFEVLNLVKIALERGSSVKYTKPSQTDIPSNVKNLKCRKNMKEKDQNCSLHIQFKKPWNIQFYKYTKLHYEILLEKEGIGESTLYIVTKPELILSNGIDCSKGYIAWARAVIDDLSYSDYVHEECMS